LAFEASRRFWEEFASEYFLSLYRYAEAEDLVGALLGLESDDRVRCPLIRFASGYRFNPFCLSDGAWLESAICFDVRVGAY
jgi:hypothetical protein